MENDQEIFRTQVLIVGAGPTGLGMAVQLLRYNIEFIIIERNDHTTTLSKAIVVQARTLEIFEELGLSKKAKEQGQVTTGLNLFYKGKRRGTVNLSGLGDGLSPFPFALSLEQSKTERLLAGHLDEHGIDVRWQCELTRLEETPGGVRAYYQDATGKKYCVEADYLVGADGASSAVRHQLGLSFAGDTVPKLFYVADVLLRSAVINRNELFIFLIEKGFIIFFPMEGKGHYRIVGILPGGGATGKQLQFDDVKNYIREQVMCPLDFEKVTWFSSYHVHSRKANAFSKGRCFIAGDAAHIHTPAGGQGMNTGIQDAYNLAWKLAYTIKKQLRPSVLETYNAERVENAKHLLQTTDRMFDFFAGTTGFWNLVRLTLFPALMGMVTRSALVKRKIFPLISQTGIAYGEGPLTIKSSVGKVRAGVRMPYFLLENGTSVFECIAEPLFKILVFGDVLSEPEVSRWQLSIEVRVHQFPIAAPQVFGNQKDFFILLRPDNHISYIGREAAKCREMLERISFG